MCDKHRDRLRRFDDELQQWMRQSAHLLRPFICRGCPLCAEVMVIGYNPVSVMDDREPRWKAAVAKRSSDWHASHPGQNGFACCWNRQHYTFDFDAWEVLHKEIHGTHSWTTRRIQKIDCILNRKLLVTNVYSFEATQPRNVPSETSGIIPLILKYLQPKAIWLHGRGAALEFFSKDKNINLPKTCVLRTSHLSGRGDSRSKHDFDKYVEAAARELSDAIEHQ